MKADTILFQDSKTLNTAMKLKKLYGLKNIRELSKLLGISKQTLNNVNYGTSGRGIANALKTILTLSEALPEKKLKQFIQREKNGNYGN